MNGRERIGDKRGWDVHFIQSPNDWEAELVDDFFFGSRFTFGG